MSDKESPQHDTDTEVDSTQLDSSNNSSESEDSQSENSEYETEGESIVSKEEENCLRYFLGIGIAEKAVRMWFDTVIPADQLENHLNSHEKKLLKNSNTEQISTLFPEIEAIKSDDKHSSI
ncbi:uncharacterized protein LOC134237238 [Saccostrea cucullata]|uniref:uncharacterized protein LOC134235279 n=1 Tax=Saccostrea cuccullata TaxID=36930 RepID=UPI002ED2E309